MITKLEMIRSLAADASLLSLRQAAGISGYDSRSLRYFIKIGRLPHLKIDRDYYVVENDLRLIERKKPGKTAPKPENSP